MQKNWLEWTVFAVGLVLTLGTLGALGWDAATSSHTPSHIEIQLGKPQRSVLAGKEQFLVAVTALNRGEVTAEAVHIEVSLKRAGQEVESSDFELAFLPGKSRRHGSVTFHADPGQGQLQGRVLGYEKP